MKKIVNWIIIWLVYAAVTFFMFWLFGADLSRRGFAFGAFVCLLANGAYHCILCYKEEK